MPKTSNIIEHTMPIMMVCLLYLSLHIINITSTIIPISNIIGIKTLTNCILLII